MNYYEKAKKLEAIDNTPTTEEENNNTETIKNGGEKEYKPGTIRPGEIRNPHGRPKKEHSITDMMREYLDGEIDGQLDKTRRLAFVKAVFARAMKGDVSAQKLVWSYMDGNPKDTIEHHIHELERARIIIDGKEKPEDGTGN